MSRATPVRRPQSLRAPQSDSLPLSRTALMLGVGLSLLSGAGVAQDAPAEEDELVLDVLKIEDRTLDTNPYAEKGAPYKARVSGDSRRTEPLSETPATITVLTQTQIQESGRSDLRAIVGAQPGITIGTGENGNAFGDRYVIRGQEARSDVFIDSLRDPGMSTRESFAVEQVEITKGPNSTFAGRGSSGGTINSISKQASSDYSFTRADLGLGSDSHQRLTLDSNLPMGETAALRVNLLHGDEDVPDRAPAERRRDGAALSALFEPNDQFYVVGDYYYLDADGSADLGTYIEPNGGGPVHDLAVYQQAEDFLTTRVNTGTLRAGFRFDNGFRLQNAARYGTTDNGYVLTGARGSTRSAADPQAPSAPTITLSTHQGWQEVEYFVDQLNGYWNFDVGGTSHRSVIGAEYSDLSVLNGLYSVTNNGTRNCLTGGGNGTPNFCMLDASGAVVANLEHLLQRNIVRGNYDSDYNVDTLSLYALDTIDLSDRLTLTLGVRWDDFDYSNTLRSAQGALTVYNYSDQLWNGNAGLSYQINDQGNVYLAFATASDINGGESDVGGSCGYGGLCGTPGQVVLSEPETVRNIEIGSKWDLFDDKLLATMAVFQVTKDDVMESVGDAYSQLGTLNTGKNRVRGMELGLTGNLSERWSTQFSVTLMDSEVLDAFISNQIGKELSNFADTQAFAQLRYQPTHKFSLGGALTYRSEMYAGQPDTAAAFSATTGEYSYQIPGYGTLDLFANYEFTEKLKLRLNVGNVFDRNYYLAAYRSGSFTYIGDARNAQLTLSAEL
ncbi:MAG: TonB-dependent receptor [Rhodanobacteraceae bacterium]|nr:TonB-dependent receptor [Rhodanobacteraceae bacterium]